MNPETLSPELVEIINRGIVNAVLLAMRADESGKDETQKRENNQSYDFREAYAYDEGVRSIANMLSVVFNTHTANISSAIRSIARSKDARHLRYSDDCISLLVEAFHAEGLPELKLKTK